MTNKPLPAADVTALVEAIRGGGIPESGGGFQKGGSAGFVPLQRNVESTVRNFNPQGTAQGLYDALTNMIGMPRTNALLNNAGFKSIQYPGGQIRGDVPHQATNVLDPNILANLFEVMSATKK